MWTGSIIHDSFMLPINIFSPFNYWHHLSLHWKVEVQQQKTHQNSIKHHEKFKFIKRKYARWLYSLLCHRQPSTPSFILIMAYDTLPWKHFHFGAHSSQYRMVFEKRVLHHARTHIPYPLWGHRERKLYSELNTAIQIGIIPLQTLFSVFIPYNTAFLSGNINVFESHKHSLLFKKHLWFLSQHNRQRSLFMRHNLYITVPHQVYCVPSLLQLNQPRSQFSTNIFIFTQQMY